MRTALRAQAREGRRPGARLHLPARPAMGLTIRVSAGTGTGATPLAAFDGALRQAGVANFNLLRLSSVIPPGSEVAVVGPAGQLSGGWGDRLYCVYAEQRAVEPGQQAWAGIGWMQCDDGSGAGLFVEHEGSGRRAVEESIKASLADLGRARGNGFSRPRMQLTSVTCVEEPVCAVVLASYQTAPWRPGR